jgi:hypothetical protein
MTPSAFPLSLEEEGEVETKGVIHTSNKIIIIIIIIIVIIIIIIMMIIKIKTIIFIIQLINLYPLDILLFVLQEKAILL